MKFTASLSTVFVFVTLLAQQTYASPLGFQSGTRTGQNGDNNAKGGQSAKSSAAASVAASSTAASAAASTAAAASASSTASASDLQSSLTLDPSVVATGFENNGQDQPTAGQVASLTSSNNFINFCATVSNLPITNGQQIVTGSCNPAPMGVIAAKTNMPSSKFVVPVNNQVFQSDTSFTVQMAVAHLDTGFFVNAEENYFAAPQFVNSAGDISGHSHVVIEKLDSITQTTPTDPNVFAFFKGLNDAAVNGVLTVDVTNGLPAGDYRIASINSAANHQPVLVAVAQHGTLDDMVYFSVADNGAANSTSSSTAAASASAASSAASATASAVQVKGNNTGAKNGQQGGFANQNANNKNNNQQKQAGKGQNNQGGSPFGGFRGHKREEGLSRL